MEVEARDAAVPAGLRPLARPVAEDPVQHVERLAHLLRVRVRAEVDDAAPVPLAREHDARVLVLDRDGDVRERLVVAQPHVERRPVALDEVLLEMQRLDLGAGDDRLDRRPSARRAGRSRAACRCAPPGSTGARAGAAISPCRRRERRPPARGRGRRPGLAGRRFSWPVTCSEGIGARVSSCAVSDQRDAASTSPTPSSASTRRGAACPSRSAPPRRMRSPR